MPSWLMCIISGSIGLVCVMYWYLKYRKKTDVKDKVVLITGASSGLGKACAFVFYEHGCHLILAARDTAKLECVLNEIYSKFPKSSQKIILMEVDLLDVHSIERKALAAVGEFGRIDVLINNAGISYRGCIEDTDIKTHKTVMTVNYFGQIALTKAILPFMRKLKSGHIVAVSSVQGRLSQAYRSAYAASKHALQAYFDCLRAECYDSNIHVCVVSPGYIQTNLSVNAVCGDGSRYGTLDKTTAKGALPEDIAMVILNAVEYHKQEVIIAPLIYRLTIVLRVLVADLVFWIMAQRAKWQRHLYIKNK